MHIFMLVIVPVSSFSSSLICRQSRSQLGAAAVLATQIRLVSSVGGGDFSLEVEGDGDDDDGT